MDKLSRYWKTIIAVLGGISSWGITASADNDITQVELYGLLGALATALAVYGIPNSPPSGEPADPNMSERGAIDNSTVVAISIVVIAVIFVLWALGVVPD